MSKRYYARSASDKSDDWPLWFVADRERGGLNVTGQIAWQHVDGWEYGTVLTCKEFAILLAAVANKGIPPSRG